MQNSYTFPLGFAAIYVMSLIWTSEEQLYVSLYCAMRYVRLRYSGQSVELLHPSSLVFRDIRYVTLNERGTVARMSLLCSEIH